MNQFKVYQRINWFQEPWVCEIEEFGDNENNFLHPTDKIGYYNGFEPRADVAEWCNAAYEKRKIRVGLSEETWGGWSFGVDYRYNMDCWTAKFVFKTESDAHMFVLKWS